MRIAMLSWEARYGVAVGGVAVHVSELAQALTIAGHEIHVFTRLGQGQRLRDDIFGVRYHRCPFEPSRDFYEETGRMAESFCRYFAEEEQRSGRFDLVHAHDWMAFRAGLKLCSAAAPLCVTFHTTELGRCGKWPSAPEAKRVCAVEEEAARAAVCLIAVNYQVRRELEMLYHPADWKTNVIFHGVNLEHFDGPAPDAGAVKARYGFGPLDPLVLCAGGLTRRKGPDLAVQAMPEVRRLHPAARLLLVGEGAMRPHLEKEIERFGLRGAAVLAGWRDGGELVDLYRSCDVVCIPNRAGAFGIPALSAWAAEKPVVAAGPGAEGEFVLDGVNGALCQPEPAQLAAGILRVFSDFDQARWMGRNGRVAAETAFSWKTVAEQTERAYRRCIAYASGQM